MPVDLQTQKTNGAQNADPLEMTDRRYKKAAYVFMALMVVYVLIRSIAGAAAKPFWIDEFCTLAVVREPGIRGIWNALKQGIDSAPPLFYLIEAAALKISSNQEIALRLPAILGFVGILICVFVYVRTRSGELIACLCSFLLLSTTLFSIYATDGRSYSMTLACIAFALVCYQRLPSPLWTALLAASLLCAESLHYFAVFAMVPFWMAEGVRVLQTRRIRWGVWLALACGILPLIVFWPLLAAYRAFYGGHIVFSHPPLGRVPEFYGMYFFVEPPIGAGLAVASLAAIGWARFFPGTQDSDEAAEDRIAEGTLLAGLTLLPLIAFVLVRLTHAILTNRYTLAAAIGMALAMACALSLARPKMAAIVALFLLSSFGLREYGFWRNGHLAIAGDLTFVTKEQFAQIPKFVQSAGYPDLPVVYGPGLSYVRAAYYAPRTWWDSRVVFLLDEKKEFAYFGNDTLAKIHEALRGRLPLHFADYDEFTAAHPEFLLYTDGDKSDWATLELSCQGASLQPLEVSGAQRLYLVKMKGDATH